MIAAVGQLIRSPLIAGLLSVEESFTRTRNLKRLSDNVVLAKRYFLEITREITAPADPSNLWYSLRWDEKRAERFVRVVQSMRMYFNYFSFEIGLMIAKKDPELLARVTSFDKQFKDFKTFIHQER